MPLGTGAALGPYTIEAPLGAGGMGEVYRARDTRLDRLVAIKVLPEHVASDPDLRQRFEREAKTVAALSHPHICPVFDVGSQDGVDFLVMEYLEGETLAARLGEGALPVDEALRIAVEILNGLDSAHRHGIVHRDLKPGNIMLTQAGAKLLDFGLAKPVGPGGAAGVTAMPTQSAGLTVEGAILGTLQYMAPEQLDGALADARTDIFALGVTLYEMITGRKAFSGKSQASSRCCPTVGPRSARSAGCPRRRSSRSIWRPASRRSFSTAPRPATSRRGTSSTGGRKRSGRSRSIRTGAS